MSQTYGQKNKSKRLVRLSLFIAILLIQGAVPMLGYITLPIISVTVIHITVAVAAIWMGPMDGAVVGLAWGLNSWFKAFSSPSPLAQLVLVNPLVSVLPRVLMPIIVAHLACFLKERMNQKLAWIISGGAAAFFNTLFVLGFMFLFCRQTLDTSISQFGAESILGLFSSIILINAIPEIIAGALIVPVIMQALQRLN